LPPYITGPLDDPELYQTVYATEERSAAAPTAGLHFTPELLERAEAAGVRLARVELDVGLDTFRPVTEEDPERHHIHTERYRVPERTAAAVNEARAAGGRVVAVGTTAVRALESAFDEQAGALVAAEGMTGLYILPGFSFAAVDALVTNFHVPRSTLLMMVSAFAGRELVMRAYAAAIEERYRMLSFGDAMLIL
ncbi:MAG: S-adenosylmethionine:tRNA ribosyltransferase-isomerase, partial [Actinobacteria bacterium]